MTDQECPCVLAAGQPGVEHTRTLRHAPPGQGGQCKWLSRVIPYLDAKVGAPQKFHMRTFADLKAEMFQFKIILIKNNSPEQTSCRS